MTIFTFLLNILLLLMSIKQDRGFLYFQYKHIVASVGQFWNCHVEQVYIDANFRRNRIYPLKCCSVLPSSLYIAANF